MIVLDGVLTALFAIVLTAFVVKQCDRPPMSRCQWACLFTLAVLCAGFAWCHRWGFI